LWKVLDIDPDVSFQEFDYPVVAAWGQHHGWELKSDSISADDKRRLMEFAEKRAQMIINGGYATDEQKTDTEKQLDMVRFALSQLKSDSADLSALFDVPIHEPPTELLRKAGTSAGSPWTRGIAAFGAGIQLEAEGDTAAALAAYRQAFDLMRTVSPTYAGLSVGINMGLPRDQQRESKEPRLLREVVRSIQRLDPKTHDPLCGGIRFRVVGPQISRNEVVKLYAALWDPSVDPKSTPFGTRSDWNGQMIPSPPGSFPIQIDGTAWIGVADGKYRLRVFRGEGGGIDGPPDPNAAKGPVELDFRGLPKDIEVKGETIELQIPSYVLETIALTAPADRQQIDLPTATFRWQSVPQARSYRIQFGYKEKISDGEVRINYIYDTSVEATSFSLANLPATDAAKFKPLKVGVTGDWGVNAYDVDGRGIGKSKHQEFTVGRGLESK
jgi:hypothetical protein